MRLPDRPHLSEAERRQVLADGERFANAMPSDPAALLRENRPERPVRLLGVRLASFEGERRAAGPDGEPQTTLAVG